MSDSEECGVLVTATDARRAATRIEGVVDAYVLSGPAGAAAITAIVKDRDLGEVKAELEALFLERMPGAFDWTLEVIEGS